MHVVIVAGSNLTGELDPGSLRAADLLVAVDTGADALARVDVVPGLLVGDLDSIGPGTREGLEAQGVEVVVLPTAKNETDTEAALRMAVERGATDITIFGGLGGPRLDHQVGNLLLLSADWLAGVGVRLVDDLHEVFLAKGDVVFGGRQGDLVSLLPLASKVESVRTEGLAYPLTGEPLFRSATRGVSNAMIGTEARVTHGEGVLLVIHYRGR